MMKIFGFAGLDVQHLPPGLQQASASFSRHEEKVFLAQYSGGFCQPATLDNKTICLAGEIFYPDNTGGQEQAVLKLLQQHGWQEGLKQCDGNFALALWDEQHKTLLLARDHLGAAPLYYARWKGGLVFASRLEDIVGIKNFDASLDMEALTAFIKFNFIPGSFTIYRQIKKLPPGHSLLYKNGQITFAKFFDPIAQVKHALPWQEDADQLTSNLQEVLRKQVKRQYKEKSVLLLSGGVDSSLLAALLREQGLKQAITIGFDNNSFDESQYAAQVAGHLGLQHTIVLISPDDAMNMLENMYDIYEEPYADASQIPTSFALKVAAQQMGIETAFVGDGGDEFFMGLADHDKHMKYGIPADVNSGRHTLASYARFPGRYICHLLFNKDINFYNKWKANRLYKKTLLKPQEPYSFYREMAPINSISNHLRRALTFEAMVGIPGIVTTKCNRPAEYFGLNLRSPILSHQVYNFAQRLPDSMLFNNGVRKYILLELLRRYLPAGFFERPKAGFSVPLSDWLKGPMRDWAEAMIDPHRLRQQGLFNVKFIRKLWESESRHIEKLWSLFMFQSWMMHAGK